MERNDRLVMPDAVTLGGGSAERKNYGKVIGKDVGKLLLIQKSFYEALFFVFSSNYFVFFFLMHNESIKNFYCCSELNMHVTSIIIFI